MMPRGVARAQPRAADRSQRGAPGSMPHARTNPRNESNTCSEARRRDARIGEPPLQLARARAIEAELDRARTRELLTRGWRETTTACRAANRSASCAATRAAASSSRGVARLSKVINSISGRIAVISLASSLPMIQVNRGLRPRRSGMLAAPPPRGRYRQWPISAHADTLRRWIECAAKLYGHLA